MTNETKVLKVAGASRSTAVAGAIAGMFRNEEVDEIAVQAIGADAVYQAVKAVCHARRFLEEDGDIDFHCVLSFVALEIDGEERTAVRLHLDPLGFPVDGDPDGYYEEVHEARYTPIDVLELSTRIYNALTSEGFYTLADLEELLSGERDVDGIGPVSLDQIQAAVDMYQRSAPSPSSSTAHRS